MGDMELNYESIESIISDLINTLENDQEEITSAYSSLESAFEQSSGKEAAALRELQKAECKLISEVQETLKALGKSIEFAAAQLKSVDATNVRSMTGGR